MRAAVFHGAHDVRVSDVPDPRAGAGEAVVKVSVVGICGSDVNRFRFGSHPWPPGFIMGHEFTGEVVEVGAGVAGWAVGAPVVVEPTLACGACFYCREGHPNRCVDFVRRGITGSGTDGGFAEFVRVPAYQLHARPAALAPEIAALVEPTAVSTHGWRLAGIERPDTVVVVGIGNIGLLAVLVARAKGARDVVAVGKYAPRQALARAYGAALVLEPDDPHLLARIHERTGGLSAALVFEAAGTATSLRTAVEAARKGGKVLLLGVQHEEVALDWGRVLMNEQQIIGSIIYRRDDFADAITILATTGIPVARHITGTIPLDDIVSDGFVPLIERRAEHVKIQVRPR
ncbi:MAG: alcohol dehydrogenase catalytic domain-containing protein [Candidatus Rokubacteria bacterium]|nr:alcohol dehydrogenase catalytic domain-containing protein [Candidatus Rokubacteria bacterium]